MPECSRTARILDHSGVDLQQRNIPVYPGFFGPTSSCSRPVPARLLTSNPTFNNETAWATFAVNGGVKPEDERMC